MGMLTGKPAPTDRSVADTPWSWGLGLEPLAEPAGSTAGLQDRAPWAPEHNPGLQPGGHWANQ